MIKKQHELLTCSSREQQDDVYTYTCPACKAAVTLSQPPEPPSDGMVIIFGWFQTVHCNGAEMFLFEGACRWKKEYKAASLTPEQLTPTARRMQALWNAGSGAYISGDEVMQTLGVRTTAAIAVAGAQLEWIGFLKSVENSDDPRMLGWVPALPQERLTASRGGAQ